MPFIADEEVVPQGRFIPDEEPAVPDLTRQPRAATVPVPSPFNYFTGGGFERTRQQIGEFGKLPLAEKKETALTPTVQLPKFTVQPDDSFIAGLAKESANQLIGLPEFATSPVGIATAGVGPVAGKIGQTAIRVGFLADTIYNFLKQAPSDIDAYIKASPGQKGAMIARWAGTGALAGTLASPEIRRAGDAIKRVAPILPRAAAAAEEAIAEAPPVEQPAATAATPEVTSASEIRSTAQVPEHEVRPQVGEETPLRQQGEPAPAGAPEAPAAEVAPEIVPRGEKGTYPITFDAKLKHLVDAEGRLVDAEHNLIESPPPSTGPTTEAAASTETPTTTPQPSEKAGAALPVEKPAETTAATAPDVMEAEDAARGRAQKAVESYARTIVNPIREAVNKSKGLTKNRLQALLRDKESAHLTAIDILNERGVSGKDVEERVKGLLLSQRDIPKDLTKIIPQSRQAASTAAPPAAPAAKEPWQVLADRLGVVERRLAGKLVKSERPAWEKERKGILQELYSIGKLPEGYSVDQFGNVQEPQPKTPTEAKPPAPKPADGRAETPSGLKLIQEFDSESGETNYKVVVPKYMIESKPGGGRIGRYATAVTPRTPEGDYIFTSGYARTPQQALEKIAYRLTPEQAGVSEGARTMDEMLTRRAAHEAVAEPIRAAIGEAFRPVIKKPMNAALADMQASGTPAIWIDDEVITPRGKYEVGKGGILKKTQELSRAGFEKNLEQIETWRDREKVEGKSWAANKAAKQLMEKRAVEREEKAKKVESDIAEQKRIDEAIRADRDAYDKEVDSISLPKGKVTDVSIPMHDQTSGKKTVEVKPMTVYGDLAIRKNELSSAKSGYKYFITHVPTGLSIGNELKIQTLKEAQRLIKGLIHTGVDLAKKEFTNEELGKLASAKAAWEDGRKAPQWWLDQRTKPPFPAGPVAKTETQTKAAPTDWTSATAEPTEYYSGIPVPKFPNRRMSELDKATTQHSGKLQKSFDEARRAQREINKEVPTERRQNAISIWREAGGDIPTLQAWAAAARGKLFKQAAIDAQNLTPKELAIANRAIAAFRVLEARGNRFDVLQSHRDNYIPHIWDVKKPGTGFGTGMLKQRFRFSKARTFNTFFEGDQAGFTPKTLAIGKLLPAYLHEMNLVIADRQFVADVVRGKASDGRELAVPKGNAVVVDNPSGKAVLVKPQASRVADTEDYRLMPNQPALTKWTWEGKDTDGKPIFVKAELGLHPEAYKRIKAVIGQSALRGWYHEPVSGLSQIPRAVVRGLDYAQGAMKREMFGLIAPFHQVQEGTHGIGHVVNPSFNIPKIDMRRADMMDAANHGLMLLPDRASSHVYVEGVGTHSSLISRGIRKLGPAGKAVADVIDGYQDYLFHHYIPGLKFKTYEALLSRNMRLYADELTAGTMTPADVKLTSAEQANAAYGHLNYGLLDRDPTVQHLIQMAALAPDFLEARARFTAQAVTGLTSKVGHEQLKAIAILAAAQAGTAIVLSNLLGVPYDPKHPFEIIYKGRRYSMRSVPEDIYNLLKDTRLFIYSRVNPLTVRGGIQALTGLNYRGEKVTPLETFEELLAGYIPLTARAIPGIRSLTETSRQNPVSPLQQLAGSFGLRISRYSPISETYKKAGEWMDAQKIDRSKGSYPVSKYQQLRYALEDGDMAKAKAEYDALRKTMTYSKIASGFQQSINHPFTDSPAHDRQFAASLKGYDRQLYDQAIRTRKQILNAFLAVPSYR